MSNLNFYLVTIVMCWYALQAVAAPAHEHSKELTIELSEVLDKSVCPIRQVIDDDPNRIPRRIKMLKCAKTPNPLCQQQNMTHACCRHHHHNFSTQCAEVVDHVLVSFRDAPAPVAIQVSVGCTCMIREGTPAAEDST